MNNISIGVLKTLRKLYLKSLGPKVAPRIECECNAEKASQIVFETLISKEPCMIARLGATETNCILNYRGVKQKKGDWKGYVTGISMPWWWEPSVIKQMCEWSGFFPPEIKWLERFCELMVTDIPKIDLLGSWLPAEEHFQEELMHAKKVRLLLLDPFWAKTPWTRALENKKVLVVHPFAETIEKQYQRRGLLFKGELLPRFKLETIKAVQSIAGAKTEFANWFEALDYMKKEINKRDYDICLIGCGAYGLPLAAHVKRSGKKGFHLGGSLQLLFGIRGRRWEDPEYGAKTRKNNPQIAYHLLPNKYWVWQEMENKNFKKIEGGCYW